MLYSAKLSADGGIPGPLAILIGIAVGTAAGAINGLLVTRLKLPPFIVTLGTLSIFTAMALLYSSGQSVQAPQMPDVMTWTGEIINLGGFRVTTGVVMVVLLYLAVGFALKQTTWGRHVYAVGNDAEASRLVGISVNRVLFSVYALAGLIYGITAWILIGRAGAASPNAAADANLESITAVVIGGTSLFGGRGALLGTLLGALIVGYFRTGLSLGRCGRPVAGADHRPVGDHRSLDRPVDQEGTRMSTTAPAPTSSSARSEAPVLSARGLVKTFGRVVGLDGVDFDLYPGEVLAIIGDNGAGKSTLIKAATGAVIPDAGEIRLDGEVVSFRKPSEAREAGIETVYQTLAVAPALDIAANMFLGREMRRSGPLGSVLRMLDHKGMRESAGAVDVRPGHRHAAEHVAGRGDAVRWPAPGGLGGTGGGLRHEADRARRAHRGARGQGDQPGALDDQPGAGERPAGHPDQPQHAERVRGRRPDPHPAARHGAAGVVTPKSHTPNEVVAIMTGATTLEETPGKVSD